jgi:hypothetical protein
MKKVLLSAFAGLFVIGATTAFSNKSGTRIAQKQSITDTVPKDTSKGKLYSTVAYLRDTVPNDTTKPKSKLVFASQSDRVVMDTVPNDTTKKANLNGSYAYQIMKDTVPNDTTKKANLYGSYAYQMKDTVPNDTTKKSKLDLDVAFVR